MGVRLWPNIPRSPPLPMGVHGSFSSVVRVCVAENHALRPSFSEVCYVTCHVTCHAMVSCDDVM